MCQSGGQKSRMILSKETWLLLLACCATIQGQANSGAVGLLEIYELSVCDSTPNNIGLLIDLVTNGDESKAINVKFSLPEDVDENLEITLIADKWENNAWQKEAYKQSGSFLGLMNDYIPKIWEQFRSKITPNIAEDNFVPADEYEIENFQDMSENIDLPQILYGRFKVKFTVKKGDEVVGCIAGEGESFEP